MKKIALISVMFLAISGLCFAEERIPDGTYVLNDGNMYMTIDIEFMPDERYMVQGEGKNKEGKTCMLMGSAKIEDGRFLLDYCPMDITYSNNRLIIRDTEPCGICEPGAYVTGVYEKQ